MQQVPEGPLTRRCPPHTLGPHQTVPRDHQLRARVQPTPASSDRREGGRGEAACHNAKFSSGAYGGHLGPEVRHSGPSPKLGGAPLPTFPLWLSRFSQATQGAWPGPHTHRRPALESAARALPHQSLTIRFISLDTWLPPKWL